MNYWLLKTEPETFSLADMQREGIARWDGVRNFQAKKFMMQMAVGDLAFFYHTGGSREIVGICEVVRTHYPDPTDAMKRFVAIDVKFHSKLKRPVTLQHLKSNPKFKDLLLIRQSRLSVMPIPKALWDEILSV